MIKYQLKNGATVSGTLEQVADLVKAAGEVLDTSKLGKKVPKGYYTSSKKGLIKISEMDTAHIRNSLLKRTKTYYENLASEKSVATPVFVKKFTALTDDGTIQELFAELTKRK